MLVPIPIPTAAEAVELGVVLFVEATALVLIARVLLRACAGRSASLRATIATTATLALLLLPLAEGVAPSWLLPGSERVPASWVEAPTLGLLTPSGLSSEAVRPLDLTRVTPGTPAESAPLLDRAASSITPPAQGQLRPRSTQAQSPSGWPPTLLVGLWLFGVGVGTLRILVAELALRSAVRRASPPSARLRRAVADVVSTSTGGRRLRVRLVHDLTSPAVTGIWRPVLLLPSDAEDWDQRHLGAVLTHEAGHLARGDVLDHQLGRWIEVFYWPNPFVRGLVARARAERERACDDYALSHGVAPDLFATTLVTLAERAQRRKQLSGAVAMAVRSPASLRERVLAVLDGVKDRRPTGRLTGTVAMLGFLALTIPLAGARAVSAERVIPGPVVRGLARANPEARRMAVARLGDVCAPEVTRHAIRLLSDPDATIRVTAAGTLASYGEPPGVAALLLAVERESQAAIAKLMVHAMASAYSSHAEAALLRLARHTRADLRALALEGLERRAELGPRALEVLAERVEVESLPGLRAAALWAMGWRGIAHRPEVLHLAANDDSKMVRAAALEMARAHAAHPVARDALGCLSQDRDPTLRSQAKAVLEG